MRGSAGVLLGAGLFIGRTLGVRRLGKRALRRGRCVLVGPWVSTHHHHRGTIRSRIPLRQVCAAFEKGRFLFAREHLGSERARWIVILPLLRGEYPRVAELRAELEKLEAARELELETILKG